MAITRYFEIRSLQKPTTTLAADIARHIQLRQRLGSAVIVCDNPHALLSATRKQWLRLSRQLQLKRAGTLNTEEILRLTHIIVLMQKMSFVAKTPEERPEAQVFFVTPNELTTLPPKCFTLYLTAQLAQQPVHIARDLSHSGLVVDYLGTLDPRLAHLDDKLVLEQQLHLKWRAMEQLLRTHGLRPDVLGAQDPTTLSLLDHAVDSLLEISTQFLTAAFELQHAIDLAQPLVTVTPDDQKVFIIITRLAYKVQTLSSQSTANPLISASYFLRDRAAEQDALLETSLWTPQFSFSLL